MHDFRPFAVAVNKKFNAMAKNPRLYRVAVDGSELAQIYLNAFPKGTNPIFRTRTHYDCSCCKSFIKQLGNVVSADKDGNVDTIWNVPGLAYPFDMVAAALHGYVKAHALQTVFKISPSSANVGVERNKERNAAGQIDWDHFWAHVPAQHQSREPGKEIGDFNAKTGVFYRGLAELSMSTVDAVLELIDANAIYRGQEHRPALQGFKSLKQHFDKLDDSKHRIFTYTMVGAQGALIRNTVIGTLLQDIEAGVDIDRAVRSFEEKVAPGNYRRTTAVVTPGMVKQATQTIEGLGLAPALERRMANIRDVNVNDVLWVHNGLVSAMRGVKPGAMDVLAGMSTAGRANTAREITIDDFMAKVVPHATSMSVMVDGRLGNNFVTLTAPVHEDAPKLFSWDNPFAWSYDGNVTDSIREKVKTAGGNVDAPIRFSLAWHNYDDLDLHVFTPKGGEICYFRKSHSGATLDVDMNAGGARSKEPVENVAVHTPMNGIYKIVVDTFTRRDHDNFGFTVEIADKVSTRSYSFDRAHKDDLTVAEVEVKNGEIVNVTPHPAMTAGGIVQKGEKWGLRFGEFAKVQTLMLSPNYWGGEAKGNKHWIFVLDGCKASEPPRGIYNEFLRSELHPHRKTMELLGERTKCEIASDQLSGLGFSSTRGDTAVIEATDREGKKTVYTVKF